jgi:hypothetical protein
MTYILKLSLVFSYVVNRFLHARHWRLRLIIRPPSLERESITLSRSSLQKGHLTALARLAFIFVQRIIVLPAA